MKRITAFLLAMLMIGSIAKADTKIDTVTDKKGHTYYTGRTELPQEVMAKLKAEYRARHPKLVVPKIAAPSWDSRQFGWVPPVKDQGNCGSCFPWFIKVKMADGSERPISQINVGDFVLDRNLKAVKVVNKTSRWVEEPLVRIAVDSKVLVATHSHAIWGTTNAVKEVVADSSGKVHSKGLRKPDRWIPSEDVVKGALVTVYNLGKPVNHAVREIDRSKFEGFVYDLVTEGTHTFWAEDILVHNCWDFSGTGVVEIAMIKAGLFKNDGSGALSEQYTLDCGRNGGCNGDDNTTVLQWAKATGLPLTSEYGPYQARSHGCKNGGYTLHKIKDWGFADGGQGNGVTPTDLIKAAIVQYGCVGCAIAADNAFSNYQPGTVFDKTTSRGIDHDVILIGWDDSKGSKGAWLLRNSWGSSWGDGGYCWIGYGVNLVGTEAVYAVADAPTPPPPPPPPPGPTPPVPPAPPGPGAPVITSPLITVGTVGTPFAYVITATNSPLTFAASGLPTGLSVDAFTGQVTGTPTGPFSGAVTLNATNAAGTGSALLMLTIGSTPPKPPAPPLPPATVTLTPDQVQSVIQQSGVVTIASTMTIEELASALQKCLHNKQGGVVPVKKPCGTCQEKDKIIRRLDDLEKATKTIMDVLLPKKK